MTPSEAAATRITGRAGATAEAGLWVSFLLPMATLWWRELQRFYRQRSRVVGVLGTPLLFWLLIGSGFGTSFRAAGPGAPEGMNYLEYFFPGTVLLIVMFTSIFSNMSLIEDRREGFLLSVLVAPISRAALVGGKVLGGATLALLQGLIFVLLAPLVGIRMTLAQGAAVAAILFLIAFALTALGFSFAWRLDSVQGFHGVMNLLLMPMWLLSGALFPASGSHPVVAFLMRLNPLGHGLSALRHAMYGESAAGAPSVAVSLVVMAAFGFAAAMEAMRQARRVV